MIMQDMMREVLREEGGKEYTAPPPWLTPLPPFTPWIGPGWFMGRGWCRWLAWQAFVKYMSRERGKET